MKTRTEKYRKLREELYSSRERAWMKKMSPKKIVYYEDREDGFVFNRTFECPCCNSEMTDEMINNEVSYCPECGQALKWEDD